MSYKKYTGKDKYHFRYYRLSNNHPFLVVLVFEEKRKNGKVLISGFNMTSSSSLPKKKPTKFIKLDDNPEPESDGDSYINVDLVNSKPSKLFTSPLNGWHLSKDDEKKIDELIERKYPNMKKSPKGSKS